MLTLLKNAQVLAPEDRGINDILMCDGMIAAMAPRIDLPASLRVEVHDVGGDYVVPGFIDQHVHLIGGGGEAGFVSRTPEVTLTNITRWGITTVVGCLGTDGITRHPESLLAKARSLAHEGISAYMYVGSYEVPPPTITGSVRSDIVLIGEIIGAGEIAVSDHRSSQPSIEDLGKLAAECRVGGMLSGKAGVLHLHIGDGKGALDPLVEVVETSDIPIAQIIPTHVNRNPYLFESSIEWGHRGGFIDITSGVSPAEGFGRAIKPSTALKKALDSGVPAHLITMSSDGNGSMPAFNDRGDLEGLLVASLSSLYREFVDAVILEGIPVGTALRVITKNVACGLRLYPRKGCIGIGGDADLVVLDANLAIKQVWARGRLMADSEGHIVKGTFE